MLALLYMERWPVVATLIYIVGAIVSVTYLQSRNLAAGKPNVTPKPTSSHSIEILSTKRNSSSIAECFLRRCAILSPSPDSPTPRRY